MSSYIRDAIDRQVKGVFKRSGKNILRGDEALPTFRKNTLPLRDCGVELWKEEGEDKVKVYARLKILPQEDGKKPEQPIVLLETDKMMEESPGQWEVAQRILSEEYKLGDAKILEDRKGKLFLTVSYSFEKEEEAGLNPNRIMGVDIGVKNPAVAAFNDSLKRKYFEYETREILLLKKQFEHRRLNIRKAMSEKHVRRGHGKGYKTEPLKDMEKKWNNIRRDWNHKLSKRIVELALENKAGKIVMEDIDKKEGGLDETFLGRYWPIAELIKFIKNKAEEKGIQFAQIDPRYSSQICHSCGHCNSYFTFEYRSKNKWPDFECKGCGVRVPADYNAAKNLADPGFPKRRAEAKC